MRAGDGYAGLVELVLPEHAGEYGAPQSLLGREDGGGSAFVSARAQSDGQQRLSLRMFNFMFAPPFVRVAVKKFAGE